MAKWYVESGAFAQYRIPVVCNTLPNSTSTEVTVEISPYFSRFWDTIDSVGDGIRIVENDHSTLKTYELPSFDSTTRTATIYFEHTTAGSQPSFEVFWLYWDDGFANAEGVISGTTATDDGYILPYDPIKSSFRKIRALNERPQDPYPIQTIYFPDMTRPEPVLIDVTNLLGRPLKRCQDANGLTVYPTHLQVVDWEVVGIYASGASTDNAAYEELSINGMVENRGRTYLHIAPDFAVSLSAGDDEVFSVQITLSGDDIPQNIIHDVRFRAILTDPSL